MTRSQNYARLVLAVVGVFFLTCSPLPAASQPLRSQITLDGIWHLKRIDPANMDVVALGREAASPGADWLIAKMPAQVQDILLVHGRIPDPRQSRNCAQTTWVFTNDWVYASRFVTPAAVTSGPVFLRSDGLDTLATLYLNGREVGATANMFRRHAFEVSKLLSPPGQTNTLLIRFDSPARFLEQVRSRAGSDERTAVKPFKHLRKSGSDFGSYLGARPSYLKMGVFRDVVLDVPDRGWLDDVWVRTELNDDFSAARLMVQPTVIGSADELRWVLRGPDGNVLSEGSGPCSAMTLNVQQPKLWWPQTHGTPHLYTLHVELMAEGRVQDVRDVTFGIRKVEPVLKDPATGAPRFAFKVNGQQLFLRGACWAPLEMTTHVWDAARASELLNLVANGHMNLLRVWGEGVLPPDSFYEECDRRGLLVWQEFMTGNGMDFPFNDPAYRAKLTAEIVDEIQRLRNHPSVFMWCGGNEHYLGFPSENSANPKSPAGRELFQSLMPALVNEHDPTRYFHPSSPWGGTSVNWPNGNYPLEGDWHDYNSIRYQPQASVPLFASEVCMVSPPTLPSMKRYLTDDEIWPPGFAFRVKVPGEIAWPPEWEYHSTGQAWEKLGRIQDYCEPNNAAELIRILGTAHGDYLQELSERFRRGTSDGTPDGNRRCWGTMPWRLNDPWPMMYMSVVDYYNQPKIAYYFLRRAYAPVLVSWEKTADHNSVWVVNDGPQPVSGELLVRRLDFAGNVRAQKSVQVEIQPGQSLRVTDTDSLGEIVRRSELLAATFAGQTAICLLAPERFLKLSQHQPKLTVSRVPGGIRVSTDKFARQVTLEIPGDLQAVFEDNYFDLLPGESRTVRLLQATEGGKVRVSAVMAKPQELEL